MKLRELLRSGFGHSFSELGLTQGSDEVSAARNANISEPTANTTQQNKEYNRASSMLGIAAVTFAKYSFQIKFI